MKPMKLLPALFLIPLFLPACGKLQSERKPFNPTALQAATTGQALSAQDFASACKGQLYNNNTMCVQVSRRVALPAGSGAFQDVQIGAVPSGAAVYAVGSVSGNSVELTLNGAKVSSVPSANNRPVTTNGGNLAFRVNGQSYTNVEAMIIECLNQSMQPVRCPY